MFLCEKTLKNRFPLKKISLKKISIIKENDRKHQMGRPLHTVLTHSRSLTHSKQLKFNPKRQLG